MDYTRIHNSIINTALNRSKIPGEYYERHHIIPRCMGGDDSGDNLVFLTGREHYVVHQLLVKMYPDVGGLVYAAYMMGSRKSSREYSWLKEKHATITSKSHLGRVYLKNPKTKELKKVKPEEVEKWVLLGWTKNPYKGKSNPAYGKIFIHNKTLKLNKLVLPEDLKKYLDRGWEKGVNRAFRKGKKACKRCGSTKCERPEVCKNYQFIYSLADWAGFNKETLGTSAMYKEYDRCKADIQYLYDKERKTVQEIADKYKTTLGKVITAMKNFGINRSRRQKCNK